MIVAPQNVKVPDLTETCHGIIVGASTPPTILSEFNIKAGILARKKLDFLVFMVHQSYFS